jgi:opacity protein-like surface antigen
MRIVLQSSASLADGFWFGFKYRLAPKVQKATKILAIVFSGMFPTGQLSAGDAGTWYVGTDTGVNLQQKTFTAFPISPQYPNLPVGETEFRAGERIDLKVGYNVKSWCATELEAGYLNNSISTIDSEHVGSVGFTQFPIIANVIFSSPVYRGLSVYAGGGLGGIISQWDCGVKVLSFPPLFPVFLSVPGPSATETDCLFGYQAKAGIKYVFSRNWDFSVGYQFLTTAAGHDWKLNDVNLPGNNTIRMDSTMSHSFFPALTFTF